MQVGTDSVKNIAELFDGTNQYRIPRYQRRYVWDVTNWEALWRDLTQLQRQIEDGKKHKKHFTGTIITHAEENTSQKKDEIIDGQQRLATFQVIFCVIRDLCASGTYTTNIISQIESAADGFIQLNLLQMEEPGEIVNNGAEDDFSSYRFIPTAHDRDAFQSLVSGELRKRVKEATPNILEVFQSLADSKHSTQNLIITAYGYFGTKIVGYLEKEGSHKLLSLSRTLSNNFHLIKVNLDSTDEPEKIFETINDTGRMLDDFDYLRNHLFLRARKLKEPTINELYSQYWEKFEEWNAKKLDLFFRAFLMAIWGPKRFENERKTIKPFDLYREYSNSLTTDSSQVKYEFKQLSCYADSYQELNNPTPVSKDSDVRTLGNRMQFYDDLNLPRLDSFILFLKHKLAFSDARLQDFCDILESYIVRQMLCPDGTGGHATINAVFSRAIEVGEFCIREFAENLQATLPTSSDVTDTLDQAWSKDVNLILYILYRTELLKRVELGSTPYAPLSFKDLKFRSRIVYPVLSDYYAADSIGNITLLTSDPPYRFPSRPFNEKKLFLIEEIAEGLILSQEIHDEEGWDKNPESVIRDRARDLLSHFDRIWRPVLTDYI